MQTYQLPGYSLFTEKVFVLVLGIYLINFTGVVIKKLGPDGICINICNVETRRLIYMLICST